MDSIILKTIELVKKYTFDNSGHGVNHVLRVHNTAKLICENENADVLVVELGALLHDIDDRKVKANDDVCYADLILKEINVSLDIINKVKYIIDNQSFSDSIENDLKLNSIEAQIVQDSDRLDSIGAIGICRALSYGGKNKRPIFEESIKPSSFKSKEEYIKLEKDNTSLNHFFEKLLKIKSLINTDTGKELAKSRHLYLIDFLETLTFSRKLYAFDALIFLGNFATLPIVSTDVFSVKFSPSDLSDNLGTLSSFGKFIS
jgi:uncharacterized protein